MLTNRRQHRPRILHRRPPAPRQHAEPQHRDELEPQQKHPPAAGAVGEPAGADGGDAGEEVGRHAHELGLVGRVAHALDDGRQEEREGVDGREARQEDEHEDVDLPVGQGLPHVLQVEVVGEVAPVRGEAALDFVAFLWGEEGGAGGGGCGRVSFGGTATVGGMVKVMKWKERAGELTWRGSRRWPSRQRRIPGC